MPMRKLKILSKIQFYICALLLLVLAGCGSSADSSVLEGVGNSAQLETQQEAEVSVQKQSLKDRETVGELDLYLLVQWNTEEKKIRLYRYATGII